MTLLGSIAEIRMGVTLRGRDATRPDPNGKYRLIRIGDISQDGQLADAELPRIEPNEPINNDLLLKTGDVLFANRGTRNTTHAFSLQHTNVIAGAQFFVLQPDPLQVMPEYLAWFLRTEDSAAYFASRRKGTLVQVLQRRDLAELPIPVPSVKLQFRIVQLAELARSERQVSERLTELKWRALNLQLTGLAHTPRTIIFP